ncbi:hypothetical protein GIB67_029451 [Kingdonia uniflora]|uniref:Uncharacterized protein n=1 Tax=Kingdonia uniflora TaxID=39325 RepID=A0A7J7NY80_9MAGN|nr:hypothetical protein GIB67_029451 [Kingdonia uniflora]
MQRHDKRTCLMVLAQMASDTAEDGDSEDGTNEDSEGHDEEKSEDSEEDRSEDREEEDSEGKDDLSASGGAEYDLSHVLAKKATDVDNPFILFFLLLYLGPALFEFT